MKIKRLKDIIKKENCKSCCNCNLYSFKADLVYVKRGTADYEENSDVVDLLPYNHADRIAGGAVHYINWMYIDDENVFGTDNIFTDAFRNRFNEDAHGNRGELDISGMSLVSAKSWADNLCKFINNKFKNKDVFGFIYTNHEVTISYPNTDEIHYMFTFYVNLHKRHTIGNLQQARYDAVEMVAATNWTYAPADAVHTYIPYFIQKIKCNEKLKK